MTTGVNETSVQEDLIEIKEIQGNVLAGFNKDHQLLAAVTFRDVQAARDWLTSIVEEIASTAEVLQFNGLFRNLRRRRGADPDGIVATWVNICFSAAGLQKLTSPEEVSSIPDAAFLVGLPSRSTLLRDPNDPSSEGNAINWKIGGPGNIPDVLVIIASDDLGYLQKKAAQILPSSNAGGNEPVTIWSELGATRSDLRGHEHFGFKDGISQPAVRGIISIDPIEYLTPRLVDTSDPRSKDFAEPGRPLVWPGHFVLGYQVLDPNVGGPVTPAPLAFPWFKNGSFLVFRRLRQDVAAFRSFLRTESTRLQKCPGFAAMNEGLFGAKLVGRWPHGAPVTRADHDDLLLGANDWANNNFAFNSESPPFPSTTATFNDPGPTAPADPDGISCPHAGHIRKVNPRDEDTEFGDLTTTLTRRILRRGIPFGPPLSEPTPLNDDGQRGLHFLCYQSSIVRQFESLTRDWANQSLTPIPGGHDPIIGQTTSNGSRTRSIDLLGTQNSSPQTISFPIDWVIPTGGGYFFAPSISAIRDRLCQAPHQAK